MTFAIYFGMLALVGILVLRRPSVALGAFLCTYGLEQWAQSRDAFFFVNNTLTNILTTCVLIWALMVRQVKGQSIFAGGLSTVFWITCALFGWSLISLLWTPNPAQATSIWIDRLPYILATILIMPLVVRDMDDLKAGFQMALLLGGVVLMLLAFASDWSGRQIVLKQGAAIGSVMGDKGSPLATASLAGWVALIAVLMNFRGAGRFWQLARWPLVMLGLVVAFRSGSRGQLFAMVAAAIIFLPFSRRIRNIGGFLATTLGVVLVLGLATFAFDMYVSDSSTRWNTQNMVSTWQASRLNTSAMVLGEWSDAGPLTWVIGLGTSASYQVIGAYPHVVMLEALAELGLVGFVLLWLVVITALRAYYRLHKALRDDPVGRGTAATIGALFMFEVILSFKQGAMLGSVFAFGFAVLIGRLAASAARRDPMALGDGAFLTGDPWMMPQYEQPDPGLRPTYGGL